MGLSQGRGWQRVELAQVKGGAARFENGRRQGRVRERLKKNRQLTSIKVATIRKESLQDFISYKPETLLDLVVLYLRQRVYLLLAPFFTFWL